MKPEDMTVAVELHRPRMYDKYAYVTTDPTQAKHRRCGECGSVGPDGCKTWRVANGAKR